MARLVIVSNRVPAYGDRNQQSGGLAVALDEALKQETLWFGWSGQIAAETGRMPALTQRRAVTLATIDLGAEDYRRFYVGFANSSLWPLFHSRLGLMEYSREDYQGYRAVNRQFAAALSPLLRPDDIVWIHDYHLIPLARELRELGHANRLGFFLHIPFPPASVFDALPCARALICDLAACDLVGFQTEEDSDNFLSCAARLAGATLGAEGRFRLDEADSRSTAIPVGIDAGRFARQAERAANSENANRMRESLSGRRLIVGVDRLDYSKGLPNRFEAYSRLLEQYPEHRLKVSYLQVTPRSRRDVGEYQVLKRNLDRQAGKINGKFAEFDWVPLRYMTRGLPRATLAGFYRTASVGLVTPLRDGMNLVAKEYVAAQDPQDPGVLVLSRFAGAAAHMKEAIVVNPYDPDEVAEAINDALRMPGDERRARWQALYATVNRDSAAAWCRRFLEELSGNGPPLVKPAEAA
ncbi:MAG: alpha,alpha-trehalose-phosphate synthase (UDP-forming) [Rhizobiales bacterium]|nr:alpha,alpha-trehalose-phosphate synthase (UDP-forming) [Hyphomicrobiales bacterium]